MNMIIEAGGTKSNIVFTKGKEIIASYTEDGFNLSRETVEEFEKRLMKWSKLQDHSPKTVYLFAAGKPTELKRKELIVSMKRILNCAEAHIESDLLAACYATVGNNQGIVAILGTGSNSCYYNGKQIEFHVSPGGFILGDEGSGAYIGKQLLLAFLRNELSHDLKNELEHVHHLSNEFIIQNVYGGTVKSSAAFCSSFAEFVISRLNNQECGKICTSAVNAFMDVIEKNYLTYSHELSLVGSIAFYLGDLIREQAKQRNIEIIKITQHPIRELSLFLAGKHE